MLWIKTIPSGPYQTNAFLAGAEDSEEAVLIDAPPECYQAVMAELAREGRRLTAVLITHAHFDHILDAALFTRDGIPIYAHKDAVADIESPQTLGLVPTPDGGFPGGKVTRILTGGDVLSLAGLELKVMETPGHANGSLTFCCTGGPVCFPGDLIFKGSVGRTDLPGGDFDILAESIQTSVYKMSDDTILFPGHGPSTSVGSEKRTNPYVRG